MEFTESEMITIRGALRHHLRNMEGKNPSPEMKEFLDKFKVQIQDIISRFDPHLVDFDKKIKSGK